MCGSLESWDLLAWAKEVIDNCHYCLLQAIQLTPLEHMVDTMLSMIYVTVLEEKLNEGKWVDCIIQNVKPINTSLDNL